MPGTRPKRQAGSRSRTGSTVRRSDARTFSTAGEHENRLMDPSPPPLWVDENPRSAEISNLRSRAFTSPRPRYAMLQPSVHARTRPLNPLRHAGLLPGSRRRRARSPRPAAAIGSAEAQATAASSERPGPTLLDYPVALLAPLDGCPRDCQIQDRRRLASGWFPAVLALEISATWRPAEDHRGDSSLDPPDGGRECRMGCTQDSRRTLEIGSCRLRANRGSIPAANPPPRGSQPKLVGLPGESSRSDRCFRLLHRTIGDVQTVALFLRHRAWTPEDPALQCDATPDSRVGGAAVA